MIYNEFADVNEHLVKIQVLFRYSKFMFFLTGSRFFGTARPISDWDYFVQLPDDQDDAQELFNLLKDNGFRKTSDNSGYLDGNTIEVFVNPEANVHVQIVSDGKSKWIAQLWMRNNGQTSPSVYDWNTCIGLAQFADYAGKKLEENISTMTRAKDPNSI